MSDPCQATSDAAPAGRRGAGLIEVVVAMTLMAVILTSLAGLTFATATRARDVTQDAYRQAILLQHVNRFMALPYDSIAGRVGCSTVSTGNLPHQACVTSSVSGSVTTLTVRITPSRPGVEPDSVVFERVRMRTANPLST